MAQLPSGSLLSQLHGTLGKQLTFKQVNGRTIVTVYNRPHKRPPTELQLLYREDFIKAHRYAQKINRDPELYLAYEKKLQPGQTVYHYAQQEYKRLYGIKREGKGKRLSKKEQFMAIVADRKKKK